MTPADNKRAIQRFVEETLNRKNPDAVEQLVVADFVEHVPFPGQGPGRAGLKDAVRMLLTAFPDLTWTTEEQVAEGDKVVSRFRWAGTHRGAFLGIPPTHRRVAVWGIVIDVVTEGQLAESRILMDTMGLLQQLGAVPAPGGA